MGKVSKGHSVAVVIFSLAVTAGVMNGCAGSGTSTSAYQLSVSRLKALNRGLLLYISDYDDIVPPAAEWMDDLAPYVTDPNNFRSPAVQGTGYGYALNSALPDNSINSFANPSTVVSVFDSTNLSRNATASPSTMPSPPRYATHNTIAYLDGHVRDDPTVEPPADQYEVSRTRLRHCAVGITLYSSDYDDRYPLANTWMDSLTPYRVEEGSFHSPLAAAANAANYGYAFNLDMIGQSFSSLENPATMTMLFDSTVLTRNATASTSTLPNPPRYSGRNTIAHADSSVP